MNAEVEEVLLAGKALKSRRGSCAHKDSAGFN